jgi:hypothetical protein
MKTIDLYYCFKKLGLTKSKNRFDSIFKTDEYAPFEVGKGRRGEIYLYLNHQDYTKSHSRRKVDYCLSNRHFHLTKVITPDIEHPEIAIGDVNNTEDALLIQFENNREVMHIFVCKGKKHSLNMLFNLFQDGELDTEIEELKGRAGKMKMETGESTGKGK